MTVSTEALDAGTLAGRKEYRRLYQNTHDPRVARMVDDAVEAALAAADPYMTSTAKSEVLREAAGEINLYPVPGWGESYRHAATVEAEAWLRLRADVIEGKTHEQDPSE